jgi:hypothetical protein
LLSAHLELAIESYQQIENVMSAMVHAIQQRYSSFHDKFQVTEADLERKLKSHYRVSTLFACLHFHDPNKYALG